MEISTLLNLPSPFGALSPTQGGAGTPSLSAPPASFFATSDTFSATPQFDLSAVYGAQLTGIPEMYRSEEQQEAETEAIKQAFTYIDEHNPAAARKLMEALLDENPTNSAAVHALGYAELADRDYEKAEQMFLRAHAMNPTAGYDNDARNARTLQLDDESVFRIANAMSRAPGQRGEAIRLLIELTERSPEHVGAHIALGDALLSEGDGSNGLLQFDAALRYADESSIRLVESSLTALAKEVPDSAYVLNLVGRLQLRQERFADALLTLERANELAENQLHYADDIAEAHVGIGRKRLDRGDITGAMVSFEAARELNPTGLAVKEALAEGYSARAERSFAQRDYDGALDDFRKAADLLANGGDADLRKRVAHGAYSVSKRLQTKRITAGEDIDEEVRGFQIAHEMQADNHTYKRALADTRAALGDQHLAAGEYQEAAKSYTAAYELFKYDDDYKQSAIDAWVAYGDERMSSANYDDAIAAYRSAYELDTSNQTVKQSLAGAYNSAGLYHKQFEEYAEAAADFKEALLLFPDNTEYQDNYNSVAPWDD